MTTHKGEHPRMGAIDVVPFIPVKDVTMEECVKISEEYAKIISNVKVPVYLYEASARKATEATFLLSEKVNMKGLKKN